MGACSPPAPGSGTSRAPPAPPTSPQRPSVCGASPVPGRGIVRPQTSAPKCGRACGSASPWRARPASSRGGAGLPVSVRCSGPSCGTRLFASRACLLLLGSLSLIIVLFALTGGYIFLIAFREGVGEVSEDGERHQCGRETDRDSAPQPGFQPWLGVRPTSPLAGGRRSRPRATPAGAGRLVGSRTLPLAEQPQSSSRPQCQDAPGAPAGCCSFFPST